MPSLRQSPPPKSRLAPARKRRPKRRPARRRRRSRTRKSPQVRASRSRPNPPESRRKAGQLKQEEAAREVAMLCDGAASLLDRISQAFAGDLPGRPDARHKRRRKGPLPYAQPQDREPRRQPLRRQRDRAAGRRREPGQRLRPRRGSFVLLEEDELQAVQLESA